MAVDPPAISAEEDRTTYRMRHIRSSQKLRSIEKHTHKGPAASKQRSEDTANFPIDDSSCMCFISEYRVGGLKSKVKDREQQN